jgi:hypothetical protein
MKKLVNCSQKRNKTVFLPAFWLKHFLSIFPLFLSFSFVYIFHYIKKFLTVVCSRFFIRYVLSLSNRSFRQPSWRNFSFFSVYYDLVQSVFSKKKPKQVLHKRRNRKDAESISLNLSRMRFFSMCKAIFEFLFVVHRSFQLCSALSSYFS